MIVATQLDPLSKLNAETDTSLFLCEEALKLGFRVYVFDPFSIAYKNNTIRAFGYVFGTQEALEINLNSVDVILIRQDPPFDLNYFTNTHLLDHTKARVINSTKSLREVSEKLSVLHFPDFIPKTLLTYSVLDVFDFLKEHKKAVLKPLYECGGRGVTLLNQENSDISDVLDSFGRAYAGPFLLQEFLPEIIDEGDKRIFIFDGEPVIGYRRTPQKGSILANLCQNAIANPYTMTESDVEVCTMIGKWLKKRDVFLAGIDLIGDRLIEINVTSPTGFRTIQELYGTNLASLFWSTLSKTL